MLDPRIYRMGLVPVVLAVIVVAFSLGDEAGPLRTNLVPDAYSGQNAWATMNALAARYPSRRPGSPGDLALAAYVAARLRGYGLAVTTDRHRAVTVDGPRPLETVIGLQAGLDRGTIAIVTHRDALGAPARAELSGTAVMLELARVLSGQTEQHTIVLASVSGSVGAVGVARLVRQLPKPVDAVLVLGDLAGASVREPVVVPWSDGQALAPPVLRTTVAAALGAQAGVPAGTSGVPGQVAHLAFPLSASEQAPFEGAGVPAVSISLAGDRPPPPAEPVSPGRISAMGRAVLESLNALDGGGLVPAPSSYLIWARKVVPSWAIRLLVLALIVPVAVAAIDAAARARRRGHRLAGWVGWVLSSALPFVLVVLLVGLARASGIIGFAPAVALPGGTVPLGAGGVSVLALAVLVLLVGFAFLRPAVVAAVAPARRAPIDPLPGAASAVMLVLCAATFVLWLGNPYVAALVAPALHLWLWPVTGGVRPRAPVLVLLVAAGLALPALGLAYTALTAGVGPVGLAWSFTLALAGGAVSWSAAIAWSMVGGCTVGVAAIAFRRSRAPRAEPVAVTVRGPLGYAGPGSLGGTESALRR